MKRVLLTFAAIAAMVSANAQTTYNYFDPADCDADGWLWFDTQEKIDKYVGLQSLPDDPNPKIMLLAATYENADFEFPEPYTDPAIKGYNAEGVQGGEGSWTGAIVLCGGTTNRGSTDPNGGAIFLQLPDCAEFALALSQEYNSIQIGLRGAKDWKEDVDANVIRTYFNMGIFGKPLAKEYQFRWLNIQDVENTLDVSCHKIQSPAGEKVSAFVRQNCDVPLLIHGIKVFTYTDNGYGSSGSGVADIEIGNSNAPVEYFNMQGVKVANPENGLYIRRQGTKVEKIML